MLFRSQLAWGQKWQEVSTWRGRPRVGPRRGGGQPGGWGPGSWACSQAAHGGVRVRPGNGFGSLERLRGGRMGSTGLCGVAGHGLGQATCSMKKIQRHPKTTIREKNGGGIMADPPHHSVIRGHCTWFSGWGNYPQATGTRPTL